MAGKFYPQIEELMGKDTWEEARPLLYEALKAMASDIPQMPIILTDGSPENELKAARGAIASDRSTGKSYVKELDQISDDETRGWREITYV